MEESKFITILNGIKDNVQKTSFNKADYIKLFAAYLNDCDYTAEDISYSKSTNTIERTLFKPAQDFRNFLTRQLIAFGMDIADINAKMETYQVRESDLSNIHRWLCDFQYQYMKTGRKLNLGTKPDFDGAISFREHEESLSEKKQRDEVTGQIIVDNTRMVKQGKYMSLTQSSSCPDYLKRITDKAGNPLDNETPITITVTEYKAD